MEKIAVIIPTMKGRETLLQRLLTSLPPDCEIAVVDDPDLLLAAKRNKGARQAQGGYLLFIDDDNYLALGAIEAAYRMRHHPEVGVVGFMACYDDQPDLIADGGSKRNYLTGFTHGVNTNRSWSKLNKAPYEVDEIANAFMMSREIFEKLGGLDEANFPIDLDEADFCKRVKNVGLKVVMCPTARCWHSSQTYSPIPNFRRPMNAYCMGKHRITYQRKHLSRLSYGLFVAVFMPIFVGFYTASLVGRRNFKMIPHFLKGVVDGLQGRRENPYQPR